LLRGQKYRCGVRNDWAYSAAFFDDTDDLGDLVAKFTRKQRILIFLFVLVASIGLIGAVLLHPIGAHLRAMAVLARLSSPGMQGFPAQFASYPFTEEEAIAQTPHGPLKLRWYLPQSVDNRGGIVLLHGIHRGGINEPRLVNFARTMAAAGVEVMTPELQDLANYEVSQRTIDIIGDAVTILSVKMHLPKVGVVGFSFAGGLSLLAANKPEYADKFGFVVAVGAHEDMSRVARFFATNIIEEPGGSPVAFKAHEYGMLVLVYSHLEDFFSPGDVPAAREALRLWLGEQPSDAMRTAQAMSPVGQQQLDHILHHREQLQAVLLQEIDRHSAEMKVVSPHGQISQLKVPVYLLHGSGDSVIPASETLWLAKDVPPAALKSTLISPAMNMIHVDGQRTVPFSQKWALVDFLSQVLDATAKLKRPGN
jgi:pimeloyl-ACP methyl ester carboxylesterase